MMAKRMETRPLLEHCEGADADDMASLMAAWLRIWRQQAKAGGTDLHCEHFIRRVFAIDKSRAGVQWTHGEIAEFLRLPIPTARKVVERVSREFGLITVVEERYARGGQAANRYKIDWQTVRAINAGLASRNEIIRNRNSVRPGATTDHPGATTDHPGATTDHPFKECDSIPDSIPSPTSPQTAAEPSGSDEATWEAVEAVLIGLPGDRRPTAWNAGLQAARRTGVNPEHVLAILRHYTEHGAAFEAGALYRRLQRCHPQLRPEDGWPKPSPSATRPTHQGRDLAIRQRVQAIERSVILASRSERLSDLAIRERIAEALFSHGLNPELSNWCREAQPQT